MIDTTPFSYLDQGPGEPEYQFTLPVFHQYLHYFHLSLFTSYEVLYTFS